MKIKKMLAGLVAAVMLLAILSLNVFAANPTIVCETKSISLDKINIGDYIELEITLNNSPELGSIMFYEFTYDKTKLELVEGSFNKAGQLFWGIGESEDEFDSMGTGFAVNQNFNGTLATIKFRILDKTIGSFEYGFSIDANYNDSEGNRVAVDLSLTSGSITITCPHANKTSVAKVPATCVSTGTEAHEKCADCGKLFLNGKEVTEDKISTPKDRTNHEGGTEIRNAEPATEEKEGYTGDTYCLGCNQIIEKGKPIPIPDHVHSMTHTAPTAPQCTDDGVLEHWTCSKCGKIYADEAGTVELESTVDPKPGHKTEVKNAEEANCTEAGYTGDEICTVCNETVSKGAEIPPKGHTTEKVGVENANCSEYGYTGDEVCTVCNEIIKKGEAIPPTGEHEEVIRDAKEADCTNEGYTGDTYCNICGTKLKDGEIIPQNDTFHRSIEHHEKVAATCIATGTCEYWHCPDCGKNYSDEAGAHKIEKAEDLVLPIDPNNHVNTEIRDIKSATCSSEGYTGDKYCTDCNTLIASGSTLAINPDGHSFVNNKCEYCGKIQVTYYPPTFTYIDDETHLAGGNIRSHVPDSMTMHTDGVYEWNYCLYCQHEYGRVPVAEVDINIDDSVELVADDPVQSTDDGDDIDVDDNTGDNIDADVNEPEDSNPPTGMAIALLPMALAAAAASLVRKK